MILKTKYVLIIGFLLSTWECISTQIVNVPPSLGFLNTESMYPFGLYDAGLESMRYQQVYGGARFAEINPKGVMITEIGWRINPLMTDGLISEQPNFQVSLSTTARNPDELSTVFAENIGSDETVVFGPSGTFWPDEDHTFSYGIVLDSPFFYDPSKGNLLLDVRNFEAEEPELPLPKYYMQPVIALDIVGDDTSRVFAPGVNATSGIADTLGIATRFAVEPIPEPSTIVHGVLGLAGFFFFLRNKRATRN